MKKFEYVKKLNNVIIRDDTYTLNKQLIDTDYLDYSIYNKHINISNISNKHFYFLHSYNNIVVKDARNELPFMEGTFGNVTKRVVVRVDEYSQMLIASKYINVPKFYYSTTLDNLYDFIEKNKNYVAKRFLGARGLGQIHFSGNESGPDSKLEHILRLAGNPKYEIPAELYSPFRKHTDNEENLKIVSPSTTLFMEDIGQDVKEYRIILFRDKYYLIEERHNYHPLSTEKARREFTYGIPGELLEDIEDILKSLYNILLHANLPFASFDLYKDRDGQYGIFEFCPEFGTDYPLDVLKTMRKHYTNSLIIFLLEGTDKYDFSKKFNFTNDLLE